MKAIKNNIDKYIVFRFFSFHKAVEYHYTHQSKRYCNPNTLSTQHNNNSDWTKLHKTCPNLKRVGVSACATKTIVQQMPVGKPLGNYASGGGESILCFGRTKVFVIKLTMGSGHEARAPRQDVEWLWAWRASAPLPPDKPGATPLGDAYAPGWLHRQHPCQTPDRPPRPTHNFTQANNFPSNEEIAAAIVKRARNSGTIAPNKTRTLLVGT